LEEGGAHERHRAGRDLTDDLADAPHGTEVFERYPRIGTLKGVPEKKQEQEERVQPQWLASLLDRYPLLARHPHPALVHFPIAFTFAVPIFAVLALLSGRSAFETTAFHCLGAGLLFAPLTIGTGFFTWWLNYDARMIKPVRIKIIGSVLLMLLMPVLFAWRYMVPELLFSGSLRLLYLLLIIALVPLVTVIGWYGATLTFPGGNKE
jgi:uncharacterized membrane protein